MSGLDPKARRLVKQHLAAYRARGHAILLGSHMAADHDGLCDRIAILDPGRLAYVGRPRISRRGTGHQPSSPHSSP